MKTAQLILALLIGAGLSGCGGDSSFSDLDQFMAEVKARPKGKIEPLPEFKAYQAFTYSAANRRSPFDAPEVVKAVLTEPEESNVKPDLNRPKELLENFAITDIAMVGTLRRADDTNLWALVSDGSGGIHRVRAGQYMGKNHGRIIAIQEGRIDLVEIVPNGHGGWVERPRAMSLQEQKL